MIRVEIFNLATNRWNTSQNWLKLQNYDKLSLKLSCQFLYAWQSFTYIPQPDERVSKNSETVCVKSRNWTQLTKLQNANPNKGSYHVSRAAAAIVILENSGGSERVESLQCCWQLLARLLWWYGETHDDGVSCTKIKIHLISPKSASQCKLLIWLDGEWFCFILQIYIFKADV